MAVNLLGGRSDEVKNDANAVELADNEQDKIVKEYLRINFADVEQHFTPQDGETTSRYTQLFAVATDRLEAIRLLIDEQRASIGLPVYGRYEQVGDTNLDLNDWDSIKLNVKKRIYQMMQHQEIIAAAWKLFQWRTTGKAATQPEKKLTDLLSDLDNETLRLLNQVHAYQLCALVKKTNTLSKVYLRAFNGILPVDRARNQSGYLYSLPESWERVITPVVLKTKACFWSVKDFADEAAHRDIVMDAFLSCYFLSYAAEEASQSFEDAVHSKLFQPNAETSERLRVLDVVRSSGLNISRNVLSENQTSENTIRVAMAIYPAFPRAVAVLLNARNTDAMKSFTQHVNDPGQRDNYHPKDVRFTHSWKANCQKIQQDWTEETRNGLLRSKTTFATGKLDEENVTLLAAVVKKFVLKATDIELDKEVARASYYAPPGVGRTNVDIVRLRQCDEKGVNARGDSVERLGNVVVDLKTALAANDSESAALFFRTPHMISKLDYYPRISRNNVVEFFIFSLHFAKLPVTYYPHGLLYFPKEEMIEFHNMVYHKEAEQIGQFSQNNVKRIANFTRLLVLPTLFHFFRLDVFLDCNRNNDVKQIQEDGKALVDSFQHINVFKAFKTVFTQEYPDASALYTALFEPFIQIKTSISNDILRYYNKFNDECKRHFEDVPIGAAGDEDTEEDEKVEGQAAVSSSVSSILSSSLVVASSVVPVNVNVVVSPPQANDLDANFNSAKTFLLTAEVELKDLQNYSARDGANMKDFMTRESFDVTFKRLDDEKDNGDALLNTLLGPLSEWKTGFPEDKKDNDQILEHLRLLRLSCILLNSVRQYGIANADQKWKNSNNEKIEAYYNKLGEVVTPDVAEMLEGVLPDRVRISYDIDQNEIAETMAWSVRKFLDTAREKLPSAQALVVSNGSQPVNPSGMVFTAFQSVRNYFSPVQQPSNNALVGPVTQTSPAARNANNVVVLGNSTLHRGDAHRLPKILPPKPSSSSSSSFFLPQLTSSSSSSSSLLQLIPGTSVASSFSSAAPVEDTKVDHSSSRMQMDLSAASSSTVSNKSPFTNDNATLPTGDGSMTIPPLTDEQKLKVLQTRFPPINPINILASIPIADDRKLGSDNRPLSSLPSSSSDLSSSSLNDLNDEVNNQTNATTTNIHFDLWGNALPDIEEQQPVVQNATSLNIDLSDVDYTAFNFPSQSASYAVSTTALTSFSSTYPVAYTPSTASSFFSSSSTLPELGSVPLSRQPLSQQPLSSLPSSSSDLSSSSLNVLDPVGGSTPLGVHVPPLNLPNVEAGSDTESETDTDVDVRTSPLLDTLPQNESKVDMRTSPLLDTLPQNESKVDMRTSPLVVVNPPNDTKVEFEAQPVAAILPQNVEPIIDSLDYKHTPEPKDERKSKEKEEKEEKVTPTLSKLEEKLESFPTVTAKVVIDLTGATPKPEVVWRDKAIPIHIPVPDRKSSSASASSDPMEEKVLALLRLVIPQNAKIADVVKIYESLNATEKKLLANVGLSHDFMYLYASQTDKLALSVIVLTLLFHRYQLESIETVTALLKLFTKQKQG